MDKRVQSVLFVTTSFPRFPGDFAGSFVFRLAKYLVRDGVQVTVLAPGAVGYPAIDDLEDVQIYRFPYFYPEKLQCLAYGSGGGVLKNSQRSLLARAQVPFLFLATMWAILRHQNQYDLIHCHWLPTALAALIASLLSRTKPLLVLTNWGSDTRLLASWLTRLVVSRIDGCITPSIETEKHLVAVQCKEFRRIEAPVDEQRFTPAANEADIRNELDIDDIPVLAFVARLTKVKDPLTFIRACAILKQKKISFLALIAGDGDVMSECRREIQRYGLHNYVLLLGMRSDPERLLRIARASVHISPVENTWSATIAEAMFMRVPVILSNAGYTETVFTHGKDCLIVPVGEPVALARAITRLIKDDTLCSKLTAGGMELLRKHRKDSVSIVRETRSYYDELLQRGVRM